MTKLPEKNKVTVILQKIGQDASLAGELKKHEREITIYFSDLEGSTAYFEKHGDAQGLALVYSVNALQKTAIEKHHGTLIKTIGDGAMAVFESTEGALSAASEVQRDIISGRNAGSGPFVDAKLRIGIHRGLCILKSDDVFGDAVNVAARVQSAGKSDKVVISGAALDHVGDEFQKRMKSLGKFPLKGKSQEEELFDYHWEDQFGKPAGSVDVATGEFPAVVPEPPPTSGLPAVTITVEVLDRTGATVRQESFQRPAISIGSAGTFAVPEDLTLAPVHAEIGIANDGIIVRDLTGTDTMLRIQQPHTLKNGEFVRFGQTTFRFELDESTRKAKLVSAEHTLGLDPDTTFGRAGATYDLSFDTFVSRMHARIYLAGDHWVLVDLNSRNGTYVYIREEQIVPTGSLIRVGSQLLRISVK